MKENNKMAKKNVLLQSCCAICSGYPIEHLKELGFNPIAYFYNPNIYPESEYLNRLEAQKTLCEKLQCQLLLEEYRPEEFSKIASGLEDEPEKGKRCTNCFEMRLNKTAQKAAELGINDFATSITISPHKNFAQISNLGKTIAKKYGINYLDINFKKKDGFLKTNKISKGLGLYRQSYCGCEFSINKEKNNGM